MSHVVALPTRVVHRYVLELRYESGELYWDRAGRIAREIVATEGWGLETIDGNACRVSLPEKNVSFSFGAGKLDLSQTQSKEVLELMPAEEFGATADSLAGIVTKALEVNFFPRIGFRAWTLFPTSDREDSYRVAKNLRLFRTDPESQGALGDISEVGYRLTVERADHMLRIAMSPFEQLVELPVSVMQAARARARDHRRHQRQIMFDKMKAEKVVKNYPQFGLLLDLDAFIEEPPCPDQLSVSDFVRTAADDFRDVESIVLAAAE